MVVFSREMISSYKFHAQPEASFSGPWRCHFSLVGYSAWLSTDLGVTSFPCRLPARTRDGNACGSAVFVGFSLYVLVSHNSCYHGEIPDLSTKNPLSIFGSTTWHETMLYLKKASEAAFDDMGSRLTLVWDKLEYIRNSRCSQCSFW